MSDLQLYFDNTSFNVKYSPTTAWADNSSDVWTGGTSKVVSQFPGAQLTFTFNGTSATFYGAALNDSTFAPVIDDLIQARVTPPSSNPPTYGEWYRTPPLQPGSHKITFSDLPLVTLDYIIVEVDPNTEFHNVPALISDTDPGIDYKGSWQKDVSRFMTLQPFQFVGDYSTQSSCNPGDTLSFSFAGSAIQFWGVFDWSLVGEVTAAFVIDGQQVAQQRYEADANSQQRIYNVQTNYPLFAQDGLTPDLHHAMVNITSCNNQRFSLDYITYTPSFMSGKDAPTAIPSSSSSTISRQLPKGAIAGIVVGGVVLLMSVVLIFWLFKKRKKTSAVPFPVSSSTVAIKRKEEVPSHMRHLRSPNSQETVDITEGTMASRTWIIGPRTDGTTNIDEVLCAVPPPAYPNHDSPVLTEITSQVTTRGPS